MENSQLCLFLFMPNELYGLKLWHSGKMPRLIRRSETLRRTGENKCSHPNDTLFVFVTEKEKLRDYYKDKITKESTYEVFIITYNEILNYNWIIPIPIGDTIKQNK